MEYLVNEKRNNQFFPGNCIYIPENYPDLTAKIERRLKKDVQLWIRIPNT